MRVSVVIPYWNKLHELTLVLEGLRRQTLAPEEFEVIIVNDGSDDGVRETAGGFAAHLNVRFEDQPHTGNRGRNRNLGAALARADRLVFLDSDMIPGREALRGLDEATRGRPLAVSLGTRRVLADFDRRYLDERALAAGDDLLESLPALNDDRTETVRFRERTGRDWRGQWQFAFSHCFCVGKDAFFSVGGFDEEFSKHWGAEDVELGYRLYRRAGCSITVNPEVVCYHLYHPVDLPRRIESLKKNYELFMRKHDDWEVELFTREFECSSVKAILIQDRVIDRSHLVARLGKTGELEAALPERTLLAGIDVPELIASPKVAAAFNPEGRCRSDKVKNIFGFLPRGEPDRFELALMSAAYARVDEGLSLFLADRLSRVARRVAFLADDDPDPRRVLSDARSRPLPRSRTLIVILNNDVRRSRNRHSFLNLALALNDLGVTTSVEAAYDPAESIDLNQGFMSFGDKRKRDAVRALRARTLNVIGDLVPCLMESEAAVFSTRAYGRRIFWEELDFFNEERFLMIERLGTYSQLLVKREWERPLFSGSGLPCRLLPAGIDGEKILRVARRAPPRDGRFVFLWAENFTLPLSGLPQVLEAFREAFGDDRRVALKVALPDNSHIPDHNEYYGPTFAHLVQADGSAFSRYADDFRDRVCAASGTARNIEFIRDCHDEEALSMLLASSDCFVSVNAATMLNPLALEAVALGVRLIVNDTMAYDGYFPPGIRLRVRTEPVSAVYQVMPVERPLIDKRDPHRYFLGRLPEKASLAAALREAFADRRAGRLDAAAATRFREEHDWRVSAETARSILQRL